MMKNANVMTVFGITCNDLYVVAYYEKISVDGRPGSGDLIVDALPLEELGVIDKIITKYGTLEYKIDDILMKASEMKILLPVLKGDLPVAIPDTYRVIVKSESSTGGVYFISFTGVNLGIKDLCALTDEEGDGDIHLEDIGGDIVSYRVEVPVFGTPFLVKGEDAKILPREGFKNFRDMVNFYKKTAGITSSVAVVSNNTSQKGEGSVVDDA